MLLQVPVSLLLDSGHTPATKIVWLAISLQHATGSAQIRAATGLSRPTVLRAAAQVRQSPPVPGGPRVKLPPTLLADPTVSAQAKVVYGLLQTTPDFRWRSGQFTYAALADATHLSRNTLKRAMANLLDGGWVQVSRQNRRSPLHFMLTSRALTVEQAEIEAARQRLQRAKYGGEAIMQEWLTVLIASDQFTDNARPGFLVNPLSNQRLELDRFYHPALAFEFNGAQHDRATDQFSQADADTQHLRDLIKAGLCHHAGIRLVTIHSEDLSLEGMLRKIGPNVPLRDQSRHALLIDLLEDASLSYCAAARARPRQSSK